MNCRDCGAPIRWANTERGRQIPLNWPGRRSLTLSGADLATSVIAYTAHFDTCPAAAQRRRAPP